MCIQGWCLTSIKYGFVNSGFSALNQSYCIVVSSKSKSSFMSSLMSGNRSMGLREEVLTPSAWTSFSTTLGLNMLKSDACRVAGFLAVLSFFSSRGRLLLLFLSVCMMAAGDRVKKSLLQRNNLPILRHDTLIYCTQRTHTHTRAFQREAINQQVIKLTFVYDIPYTPHHTSIYPYLLNNIPPWHWIHYHSSIVITHHTPFICILIVS